MRTIEGEDLQVFCELKKHFSEFHETRTEILYIFRVLAPRRSKLHLHISVSPASSRDPSRGLTSSMWLFTGQHPAKRGGGGVRPGVQAPLPPGLSLGLPFLPSLPGHRLHHSRFFPAGVRVASPRGVAELRANRAPLSQPSQTLAARNLLTFTIVRRSPERRAGAGGARRGRAASVRPALHVCVRARVLAKGVGRAVFLENKSGRRARKLPSPRRELKWWRAGGWGWVGAGRKTGRRAVGPAGEGWGRLQPHGPQ